MYIEKVKSWKWLVTPSHKSHRRRRYSVVQRRDQTFSCECKSYRYGTDICKHIQAVISYEQSKEDTEQAAWEQSPTYLRLVGVI